MRAKIEVMKSRHVPMWFVTVYLPTGSNEDGVDVTVLHHPTHLTTMIPIDQKPIIEYVPQPGDMDIDDVLFGWIDLEDFMRNTFIEEEEE